MMCKMATFGKRSARTLLAIVAIISFAGCGSDADSGQGAPQASLAIAGLHPPFDVDEERYVSRCGPEDEPITVEAAKGTRVAVGARQPRSGTFAVAAPARPGEDFTIRVRGAGASGPFKVRCLPADFPRWRFNSFKTIPSGLFVVAFSAPATGRPWVIVFDHMGTPRWWYRPATRALWAQVLRDGSVSWARSFGDGYGLDPRMAHEVRSVDGRLSRVVRTRGEIVDGHEFRELDNGNVFIDTYAPASRVDLRRFEGPEDAAAVFAEVQEIDPQGKIVWHWNSRGKIGLGETGRWWRNVLSNAKRADGVTLYDPVHINSIEPRGADEVIVSMRHTDAIYGIDRPSGEIVWKLGGTETAESLRIVGDPAAKLFGGQHDARVEENGDISVYDNGKDRPRRPRVVSYRLDLEAGQARYLGQLNDPLITTSHCCGSARPLSGGGRLVSWGDNPLVTAFDESGRTAFRLHLPVSTFRAVPVPAGATSVEELDRGLEAMEASGP
jgi:Arylsulfotransferase (ASST)